MPRYASKGAQSENRTVGNAGRKDGTGEKVLKRNGESLRKRKAMRLKRKAMRLGRKAMKRR